MTFFSYLRIPVELLNMEQFLFLNDYHMTQFHDDDVMVTVTFVAQAFHYDKEVIPVVDSDPCHKCGQPFREQSYSNPSKKC